MAVDFWKRRMREEPLRNGWGEALCGVLREAAGAGEAECLCGHEGGADCDCCVLLHMKKGERIKHLPDIFMNLEA